MQIRAGGFSVLPPVVKNLIIINALMFLSTIALQRTGIDLTDLLGLHYFGSEAFRPHQIITYMFMHGSFGHLFFNMFAVWMFGSAIENLWGPKRFLLYYILTGIGAAILHYLIVWYNMAPDIAWMEGFIANPSVEYAEAMFNEFRFSSGILQNYGLESGYTNFVEAVNSMQNATADSKSANVASNFMASYLEAYKSAPNVVGASGSLFGLLLAFGMMFPNQHIFLLFFPFPIKAKYFVLGYGLIELFSGIQNSQGDNVAHFAHLGGMLFGYLLIRLWKSKKVF